MKKGVDKEVLRKLMGYAEFETFETTDFYYVHILEGKKNLKEYMKINLRGNQLHLRGKIRVKNKNSQINLRVWCTRRNSNPRPSGS